MAEQPIDEGQIIKDGAIKNIIDGFQKIEQTLKGVDAGLKSVAESSGKITFPTGSKDFEKVLAQMAKMESAYKTQHKTQEDLGKVRLEQIRIEKAREKSIDDYNKKLEKQEAQDRKTAEQATKSAEKTRIANEKASNAYNILSRETLAYKNESKRLGAELLQLEKAGNRNSKEYKDLARTYADVTKKAQQGDASLKKLDATVGDNTRKVGMYENAIKGLKGGLGQLGLVFGGFQLAKAGFQTLIDFETKVASFRTIVSDLNNQEFSKFTDEIKNVATNTKASTVDIASSFESIAGLNADFAKTADGLGQVSEAAITLSKASGDELGASTENLVGIMNQFDLSAKEANRTINVLAAGQAVGASSITQSSEAYKNFGTVAKGANIDLEKSQALIQTIGKFSIFGAEAGTKLRGATLQLQKANLGYQSGQFNINDALDDYNKLMSTKKTQQEKDAASIKVFGAENVTVGKILANNIPLINQFEKGVTGTNEATKAAEINSKTLSVAWQEFKNVITNALTGTSELSGGLDGLRSALDFVSNNIGTIIKVATKLLAVYLIMITRQKLLDSGLLSNIKNVGSLSGGLKKMTEGLKEGAKAGTGLGGALKGIGVGLAIGVFIELAMALYDIASGAANARDAMARLDKQMATSNSVATQRVEALKETQKQQIAIYNQELKIALSKSGLSAKAKKDIQSEYDLKIANLKKTEKSELESNIKTAKSRKTAYETQLNEVNRIREAFENRKITGLEYGKAIGKYAKELGMVGSTFKAVGGAEIANQLEANIKGIDERVKVYSQTLKDNVDETKDFTIKTNESATAVTSKGKATKKTKEEIVDYTKALRDLNAEMIMGADDETTDYLRAQEALQNKYNDDKLEVTKKYGLMAKEYLEALDKEYDIERRKLGDEYSKARLERIKADKQAEISLQGDGYELNTSISETDERLAERARYNIVKGKAKTDKELEELAKEHELNMLQIEIKATQGRINAARTIQEATRLAFGETSKEYKEATLKLSGLNEQMEILKEKEIDFKDNIKIKGLKDLLKDAADLFKGLFDIIKNQMDAVFDRLIEAQNRSIDKSKALIDSLKASAINGNTQAKESILAQEKAIEDSQKRIEKLQKRKQRMELISSGINSFNSKVASGKSGLQALGETGAEMAGLMAILSALPSFFVGAERLSNDGQNIDGKGGFLAINHPNERIVTAKQNKMIGYDTTNKQLANVMDYYNRGLLVAPQQNAPVILTTDNTEVLKSIENGFSKINNWDMTAEQLFDTITIMINSRKNGDIHRSIKKFK